MEDFERELNLKEVTRNHHKIGIIPIVLFIISFFILIGRSIAFSQENFGGGISIFVGALVGHLLVPLIISLIYYIGRKRQTSFIRAFFITTFIVVILSSAGNSINQSSGEKKTFATLDGCAQIKATDEWGKVEVPQLKDDSGLCLSIQAKDFHHGIILLRKISKSNNLSLQQITDSLLETYKGNNNCSGFSNTENLVINNNPAMKFEFVENSQKDEKISHIITIIETTNDYYQFVTTSKQSYFSSDKDKLMDIINSFSGIKK